MKLFLLLIFLIFSLNAKERPNVLFIAVDDMNDWLGCFGYGGIETPNLDKLSQRGVFFTDAHTPSPKCGPARAAILLGKRPSSSGIYSNSEWWRPAFPDALTIPHFFKKHGYYVAGSGKIHHHTAGFNPPDQWHEYFDLIEDKKIREEKSKNEGIPRYITKLPRHPNGSLDWGPIDTNDDLNTGDGHTVKWAMNFLKKDHQKPFFLAVGLFQPHLPFYAPKKYFDELPLNKVKLPINKKSDIEDLPPEGKAFAAYRRNDLRMIEEHDSLKNCMRSYLASIRHADTLIGHLIAALDKSSYAQNTIIVFWSDHGYHFGEKDHYAKNTLWQRSTHIPYFFYVPGMKGHQSCDHPVDLMSIFPTLIELCDLPQKEGLEGHSIVSLLNNPKQKWSKPAIIDFGQGNTAVCTTEYRFINYHKGGQELYDRHLDPNEWKNLAILPEYKEVISKMSQYIPKSYVKKKPGKSAYKFLPNEYSWELKQK